MSTQGSAPRTSRRSLLKAASIGVVGAATGATVYATATPASAATFAHPGMLHTQADISRTAARVAAGAQPWSAGWTRLTANTHAQKTWTASPLPIVYRGAGTPENYGTLYNDIAAAYQNALRWRVTGIASYADTARNILNAWSATLTKVDGTADRFIAAGIYGYQLANAAELMRGYSGFDLTRFQNMMLNVFYPLNHDFLVNHNGAFVTNYWASWDLLTVASVLAIGILCDDTAKVDEAVSYFKTGVGMGSVDNVIPYTYPAQGLAQWVESGRDQAHTMLGVGLFATICEMAWNQGIDLYGYENNKFLAACEYVARYNLGEDVPFTPYTWDYGEPEIWSGSQTFTVPSNDGRGDSRPIWEMIYNHYVNRRGLFAPNATAYALRTRPEGGGGDYGPNSGGYDHLGFGTLSNSLVATTTLPTGVRRSWQSVNDPTRWFSYRDNLGFLDPVDVSSDLNVKQDATIILAPGLANADGYSLQTLTGRYLRHSNFRILAENDDGSATFAQDATFYAVPGSASGSVCLVSCNYGGRCIRHRNNELWVDTYDIANTSFPADSSFQVLNAWA